MAFMDINILPAGVASLIVGLLTTVVALRLAAGRKVHPNEPTVLPSWIPFIGHLVGMAIYGGRLSHPNEPIFTLPVPGSRIYVVTDPSLAASIQRNVKTMSFTPLVPDITKRVLGLDDETVARIRKNLDPEPGDPRGFLAGVHYVVYSALGPGWYLNSLSCEAGQELCFQLTEFAASFDKLSQTERELDLLQWARHLVTVGSARYLYGPRNPIAEDQGLEAAFWAFDQGLGGLLMGVLPSLTASEAYQGRERLVTAFMKYFEAGHIKDGAQISRDRVRLEEQYGMNKQMIARSALSFIFASIVNTTTATFWMVLRLFANKKCPTLVAVFRESLRIGSENFSVRLIKEDVLLADRYFLKKDAVVQIAGGIIHAAKSIWGDDADEFNPQRFLAPKAQSGGIHPAAFRGFGSGKTLCPGRHFATNEILLFAALIVHGLDMSSPDGRDIRVPRKNDRVMPVHILEPYPRDRPKVLFRLRDEMKSLRDLTIVI
ncbi:cytochrome P450 [Metarhizium robertsii]|uniref:Cytochrome P450 n=1 Tax=Metarhizium robertsii TaxID=568076 RepID=A0A0A1V7Y1_9HYPO|nr:cytochrome P450 [Metarhizium robertsii]